MHISETPTPNNNLLFPIFLQLEKMNLLIVGGGVVALEKLNIVLKNSPHTKITIVGIVVSDEIKNIVQPFSNIRWIEKKFSEADIQNHRVAIIAINDIVISTQIYEIIKLKGVLCNVADKPALCDFYFGSIVQKGALKIAISTNGKSPTMAKRVKEFLDQIVPENINIAIEQLEKIKHLIKNNFEEKVKQLNAITQHFVWHKPAQKNESKKNKNISSKDLEL